MIIKNPCSGFSEASENTIRIADCLCNLLFGLPLLLKSCSPPSTTKDAPYGQIGKLQDKLHGLRKSDTVSAL
jgi:hypothetical protein